MLNSMIYNIRHSTKKSAITFLLECFHCRIWQSISSPLEAVEAGVEVDEGEFQTETAGEGFEDFATCGNHFAANAIAGDES